MGSVALRLEKVPEFERAQLLDLKNDRRFDENWLERLICDNLEILGLGKVRVLSEQKRQKGGIGRLDLVLESEDKTVVFVVELMLGEVDSGHIVRTIDYWLETQKSLPRNVECKAVLIGERIIDSRFGDVVKFLAKSIPLVVKEVAALQVRNTMTLHLTTIFRSDDLEERAGNEEETVPANAEYWAKKDSQTLNVANAVIAILRELNSSVSPNFAQGYINVRVGARAEGFIGFRPVRGKVRLSVKVENASGWRRRLASSGLQVIQTDKTDNKVRLLLTEEEVRKNKRSIKEIAKAGFDYWFG